MKTKHRKLSAARERALAVKAFCDPRTITKYIAGEPVAALCVARIERALREAGLHELIAAPVTSRTTPTPPEGAPSAP